jgi:hypothetical protein
LIELEARERRKQKTVEENSNREEQKIIYALGRWLKLIRI